MGDCSCKEEQIKLQECEAKLSHLQDVFENNVQSKVAMTNLGLLNIGVEENSNSTAHVTLAWDHLVSLKF